MGKGRQHGSGTGAVATGHGCGGDGGMVSFTAYPARFWILFQFSFLAFNQSMYWITFSPIAGNAEAYYGVSEAVVTWWLNVGVIGGLFGFPFATYYTASASGLKRVAQGCAVAGLVMTALRLIAPLFHRETALWSVALVFVSQFIAGVLGPFVMGAPVLVSAQWFPEKERARATAVSSLACNLGSAIGMILGPLLVKEPAHVVRLLLVHAGVAVLNAALVFGYLPAAPPTPPSASAKRSAEEPAATGGMAGLWPVLQNSEFVKVSLASGVISGIFNAWSGSFDQILPPLDKKAYTQTVCGWLGFSSTLAMMVGALISSPIADSRAWSRRLKTLLVTISGLVALTMAYISLALPSVFSTSALVPSSFYALSATIVLCGMLNGAVIPLYYELGAELTYPQPESTSANVTVLLLNVASFLFLFATPPLLHRRVLNVVYLGGCLVTIGLFLVTRTTYRRKAAATPGGDDERSPLLGPTPRQIQAGEP